MKVISFNVVRRNLQKSRSSYSLVFKFWSDMFNAFTVVNNLCSWVKFTPNKQTNKQTNITADFKTSNNILQIISSVGANWDWWFWYKFRGQFNFDSTVQAFIVHQLIKGTCLFYVCVFEMRGGCGSLFNGQTMKTSCLLCKPVSVLHLWRKRGKKRRGAKKRERDSSRERWFHVINMGQLSSRNVAFCMTFILPLHPCAGGNADQSLQMALR